MTAPALTLQDASRIVHEALLDRSYEQTELGPLILEYLAWKKLGRAAERTLDQYERDISRLAIRCAHVDIASIGVADLMLVLTEFPPGSWRRVRAAWNSFFTWSVLFEHRGTNPMDRLPELRPEPRKVFDTFNSGELALLVKAQDDSLLPVRDRLGALIFQELGVRKEEARLLQVAAFDLVDRVVTVRGKGGKERAVPFTDSLWTALMEFLNAPVAKIRGGREREPVDTDFIFFPSQSTGRYREREPQLLWTDPTVPMAKSSMHRWWQRCVERAGVRYRSLHVNRHTVATDLVEADVDAFTVRDWLGHADLRTSEVYVHNSRRRLRKASEKLRVARRDADADNAE